MKMNIVGDIDFPPFFFSLYSCLSMREFYPMCLCVEIELLILVFSTDNLLVYSTALWAGGGVGGDPCYESIASWLSMSYGGGLSVFTLC